MPFTEDTLPHYLQTKGWIRTGEALRIARIPGGVSCALFKVELPGRAFVVKQALEKLEVEADWRSDPSRISAEIDCMFWVAKVIGPEWVPQIFGRDDENFLYVMEYAPNGSENWKERLLRGEVQVDIAERVGDFLGRIHSMTHDNSWARDRFKDKSRFEELRLDAYLRHTSKSHPDLADRIDEEIGRLAHASLSLVHGDYSPKNFLLLPDGRTWILDWEVAHYGHPVFDCAFCLNHLLIKAQIFPAHRAALLDAARGFWAAYRARSTFATFPHLGRLIGMLMLARVDGKSPVEYVRTEALKNQLRQKARHLIHHQMDGLNHLLE